MIKSLSELSQIELNKLLEERGVDISGMYRLEKIRTLRGLGVNEIYLETQYKVDQRTIGIQTNNSIKLSVNSEGNIISGNNIKGGLTHPVDGKFKSLLVNESVIIGSELNVGGMKLNNYIYEFESSESDVKLKFDENYALLHYKLSNREINIDCEEINVNYFREGKILFNMSENSRLLFSDKFVVNNNNIINLPIGMSICIYLIVDNKVVLNFLNSILESASLNDLTDGPINEPNVGDRLVYNENNELEYQIPENRLSETYNGNDISFNGEYTNHIVNVSEVGELIFNEWVSNYNEGNIIINNNSGGIILFNPPNSWNVSGVDYEMSELITVLRYVKYLDEYYIYKK